MQRTSNLEHFPKKESLPFWYASAERRAHHYASVSLGALNSLGNPDLRGRCQFGNYMSLKAVANP